MPALAMLIEALEGAAAEYEVVEHPRTETARAEAHALGLPADDVAKNLVVKTPEGYLRVVLPASRSLDLRRLPFGGARDDRVLVDRRVAERDRVVFEAGDHAHSIRLPAADLLRVAGDPEVADVCVPPED